MVQQLEYDYIDKEHDHDEQDKENEVHHLLAAESRVASFRLLLGLETLVAVAAELVHLVMAIRPLGVDPWNPAYVHNIPLRRHTYAKEERCIRSKIIDTIYAT